ncbi:MAG: sigma 54-interacting transcriptional regulator, partial [Alphaproteobacteria bacterium]
QDKEIRPVGGRRSLHVDVRIIAATNKDLGELVSRGLFREDLYYRLEVVPIDVPPLRDRRSDISLLVDHFLRRQNAKCPGHEVSITDDAMNELCSMDWPGNVRELENAIERLGILCDGGRITVEDVRSGRRPGRRPGDALPSLADEGFDLAQAVEDFENRLIEEALRRTKGNKQAAARMLGVKRTTLASKLRRRGDLDPEIDEPEDDEGDLGGGGTEPGPGLGRPTLQ